MARVVKRTGNSVNVRVSGMTENTSWKIITVGGSVIFKCRVTGPVNEFKHYFMKFSKKYPSDKVNYIVTYTHWAKLNAKDTAVMRVRADDFGADYYLGDVYKELEVNVEINTEQLSSYATIYDDAELTDFMLRGEDGSVPFHKVVIAAHSSVFKTMLAGKWKETSEGVIDIPGTSKELLQHLKKYMYLGKLPEKQNEQVECLKQLLLLSSCYLIEDLTLRCIKELRFLLTPENVPNMLQFAMQNNFKQLFVEIFDCVKMDDIDFDEMRKHVEAEDATLLQFK